MIRSFWNRLDDNERGAFHYLFGGVAVVLLLKIAGWLFTLLGPRPSEEELAFLPFQQGYLSLHGEQALAATAAGLQERIVLAVVASVFLGFMLAFIFAAVARAKGRPASRTGTLITRAAMTVMLVWSLYAVCFLPLRETHARPGELVIIERTALVGDIPVPFFSHEWRSQRMSIDRMEAGSEPPAQGQDGACWIDIIFTNGVLLRIGEVRYRTAEEELPLLRAASTASALMERELR